MVGGHATVGWLSNNVFWTFQAIRKNIWKKSLNGHATVVGGHATGRLTVKQRFLDVSSDLGQFWKKSLNGHATVVGVTRPSADCQTTVFGRFKRFGKILKKSLNGHATVVGVTRPSADCQTTFFGRFKRFRKILKKVAERSRDSGRRSRDCRLTVKQLFFDVSSN